jgi:hypothetical protein
VLAEDKSNGAFDDLVAQAEKDMLADGGPSFHAEVSKTFLRKYSGAVTSCSRINKGSSLTPFQIVLIITSDGTVSQVAVNPETDMSKCARQRLLKAKFGRPPFAPFHDLMKVSLEVAN